MKKYLLYIFYFAILNCICNQSLVSQSGHWEKIVTKDYPSARESNNMASIGEKKVILFGGYDYDVGNVNDTWIFDLNSKNWTKINCKYSPEPRNNFSITQISKNKVLLFGGETEIPKPNIGELRNDFWIFDLDSMNWYKVFEDTTNNFPGRYFHNAALYNDSLVLIFAGIINISTLFTSDIYLYNINTNLVSNNKQTNYSIVRRSSPQMDRVKDNLIFFYGGWNPGIGGEMNDNLKFDEDKQMNSIKVLNNTIPQAQAGLKHIRDGVFLMFGGTAEKSPHPYSWYDSTWIFNYYERTWKKLEIDYHPNGRRNCGMALIDTNKIVMFGGSINAKPSLDLNNTWLFVLDSVYTAINEYTDNNTISIYQVSSNELKIELSKIKNYIEEIIIYDILGVPYTPPNPILIDGEQLRVDISGFVPGVYFVKFGDVVQRFVKI